MKDFFFQIIRSDEGCRSYVLADSGTKRGLVWDPSLAGLESTLEVVAEQGLTHLILADSHTHADHFSATAELAKRLRDVAKVEIVMGEKTESERPGRRLRDGDRLDMGPKMQAVVLATPGHTEDSICLYIEVGGEKLVLTGDSLLIGSSGRTDFPGASAEALYHSLHEKIMKLPGTTWLFPGHDYSGYLFSRLEVEAKQNSQLAMDKSEFLLFKPNEVLDCTPVVPKIVDFNRASSPSAPMHIPAAAICARSEPVPGVRSIGTDELRSLIGEHSKKSLFIDVREPDEVNKARIPGLQNIPLSLVWTKLPEIAASESAYFSCQSGRRSGMVTATLARLGFSNAINVAGGIQGWMARGYHVEAS